jgi:copper(I)-binding protein
MNMIMKNLALAFSALAIGTASVPGQPTSAPAPVAAAVTNALGPKIKFATPMYDFGKARSGEPVKYTYIFTNTGDQLLILTNVVPQCGCTAAGDWTRQVEPGKTGNIPIQFNTANYNGAVFKQVTVTCNDKSQSTLFLQLKGTVYKPLEINPQLAVLNISPDAETGSMVVNITNNMDEALSLSAPESNNRAFAAELKTIQPGKGYQLTISAVPPLKPGSTQGQISLKTSWTNQPVLTVSVYANVQPPIVVIPSHITLPPAPLANSQTPSITIQNNSTNQLTLSEPAVNAQGVETQIKEMQPGRSFTALVTFPQGFEIPPGQQVELTVKSSNPNFPVVRVPITQFPRPAVPAAPPTPAAAATPDLPPLPTTLPETK